MALVSLPLASPLWHERFDSLLTVHTLALGGPRHMGVCTATDPATKSVRTAFLLQCRSAWVGCRDLHGTGHYQGIKVCTQAAVALLQVVVRQPCALCKWACWGQRVAYSATWKG